MSFYNLRIIKSGMKEVIKNIVFSLFFILPTSTVIGQYSDLGVGLGFSTYWGDLNNRSFMNNYIYNSGLAIQGSYRYMRGHKLGLRISGIYGSFRGADRRSDLESQKLRNLSFKSRLVELAVMGEYYPLGLNTTPGARFFAPYLTLGAGLFHFDPKTVYRGNEIRLQPLGTEGQGLPGYTEPYSLTQFAIPFGGGIKFILTETLNIGIEVVMRRTFTDYIDDVSTIYLNYDEHTEARGNSLPALVSNRMNEFLGQEEPVQVPTGTKRGGSDVDDYYITTMFTLQFMITDHMGRKRMGPNRVNCPTF